MLLVLLVLVAAGACGPAAQGPPGPSPQAAGPPGALAYRIVEELSGDIGARVAGTPAEFAKVLEDATEKWAKVIKAAGIKAE